MRRALLVLAVFGGVIAVVVGLGLSGILALSMGFGNVADEAGLLVGTLALGIGVASLGLGLVLAWTGWRGLSGAPGRAFGLPRWGWWLIVFIGLLAAGYAIYSTGSAAPMAFVHVGAGATAAFFVLALAVGSARRGAAAASGRAAIGSLAWGGLGAVGLAFAIEMLVVLGAAVILSVSLSAARPELLEQLRSWATTRQGGRPGDLVGLLPLLRSPWVVLALLGFASFLAPLVEEVVKSLVVPLVAASGRRLRRVDAFLLGAAAGAGFALVEGVLSGAMGLASPAAWVSAMLLRSAAATMHVAASALAGLGWHAIIVERRWLAGLSLGLLAVMLHGAWNAAALGIAARMVVGGGNLGTLLFVAFLSGLWLLAALSLAFLPRWLARIDALSLQGGQSW